MKSEQVQYPYGALNPSTDSSRRKNQPSGIMNLGVVFILLIVLALIIFFLIPKSVEISQIGFQKILIEKDERIKNLEKILSEKKSQLSQCRREDAKHNQRELDIERAKVAQEKAKIEQERLKLKQEETELKQLQSQCKQQVTLKPLPLATQKKAKYSDSNNVEMAQKKKVPQPTTKQRGVGRSSQETKKSVKVTSDKKTNIRKQK